MDIQEASTAVDLFGPITDDPKLRRAARRKYRLLLVELHPDKGGTKETFLKLQDFWEAWESGKAKTSATATAYKVGRWSLGPLVRQGSISNLYTSDVKALIKLPRKASSNHFIQAEIDALTALSGLPDAARNLYPRLLDSGTAGDRQFSVQSDLTSGYFTLAEVLARHPLTRLPGADYAWMHRRLLGALAGAHQQGIVHGAVLPEHILIHPASHDIRLCGWSFSGKPGTKIPARVQSRATLYPWSTTEDTLSPEWDVYMAHSVMRWSLHPAEKRQHRFAAGCTLSNPSARPTALQSLTEYDDLLYRLYGKRTFRPFAI